ncbi:MAG: ATP-binding protein [Firmicutes bacterium]|nr:ATP-binding protein [Bacillota bacterium]
MNDTCKAVLEELKSKREFVLYELLQDKKYLGLEKNVRALNFDIAQAKSKKKSTKEMEVELGKAISERNKIIEKKLCKGCRNTGYANEKICTCVEKEIATRLHKKSGLIKNTPTTFDIKDGFGDASLKKVYDVLSKYAVAFPNAKRPNIVLCGATGTGKTYGANILGNVLVSRGVSVIYVTAFSLIERFKEYIFEHNKRAFHDMIECDLLIIDDLGVEPQINNITQENLYNLINERLIAHKPFVITTNLSPEHIFERYDQRIASRIFAVDTTYALEFKGKDLRIK